MVALPLLVNAGAAAMVAVACLFVAAKILGRQAWVGDRRALNVFAAWWLLYGLQAALVSVRLSLVASGQGAITPFMLVFYAEVILSFLALGGLVVYAHYLWRGRYLPAWLVFGTMGVVACLVVAFVEWHGPREVLVESFRTNVAFRRPFSPLTRSLLVAGFYVPVAALAALFLRVGALGSGTQRKRAFSAATVLLLITAASTVSLMPPDLGAWSISAPLLRAAAAVVVFVFYLRT